MHLVKLCKFNFFQNNKLGKALKLDQTEAQSHSNSSLPIKIVSKKHYLAMTH